MPKAKDLRKLAERVKNRFQTEVQQKLIEVRDNILPELGKFAGESRLTADEEKRARNVIITTAERANDILAAGLQSGMTSPSQKWFLWRPQNPAVLEVGNVRAWFDEVERIMYQTLAASNFYHVMHGAYTEFGPFGIFDVLMEEDEQDVVRFVHLPVGAYYWARNARGEVDTVVWDVTYSARQLAEKFGEDNMSTGAKSMLEKDPDARIECKWIVIPRKGYNVESSDIKDAKYAAYVIETGCKDDVILHESGYREFPHLTATWFQYADDVYSAKSPGICALPDVRMLQHSAKRVAQAADKAINPPMRVPKAYNQRLKLMPGAQNEVSTSDPNGIAPLYEINPASMTPMQAWIEQTKQSIREHFFEDVFMAFLGNERSGTTATEILETKQEKMVMLGPVIGRFMKYVLDPLLYRLFNILYRNGMIPQVPQELASAAVDVEYVSILAQAQRSSTRNAISGFVASVGQMAQLKEDVLDKLDIDQVVDELASIAGVPAGIIRPDDQVAGLRRARVEVQQQQAQMQGMQAMAQIGRDAGNIKTTPDTLAGAAAGAVGLQ